MSVRLTQHAKRAGCAAKHPPGYLLPLLGTLPKPTDPNVLIGSASCDDAAIYRLDAERALVLTTDFFTPIVDDPYAFGQVAAANALSDVYAMGGRPIAALNLVGFPDDTLPVSVLGDILRGGADKAREAGIDLVGGHTMRSEEPIYGLAVTGLVHPHRVVSNAGARPGDRLVLSKPLGLGIISTAAKRDEDGEGAIDEAVRVMATLNRGACEAMLAVDVRACTDVTGFGLLGHLRNMMKASGTRARVSSERVPVLEAARRYVRAGIVPGGTYANRRFLDAWVDWDVEEDERLLLADAQTSGGLLMAVAEARAEDLVHALQERGTLAAAIVGEVLTASPADAGRMHVVR